MKTSMKNDNMLILLVGKSGSGKTAVAEYLKKQYLFTSIDSYTTRPKRTENESGHIFISHNEYLRLPNKVASTYYNGNYYCATKEQCDNSDIYIIDPTGVESLKANYKNGKELLVIYLDVGAFRRFVRMIKRGDSIKSAIQRIRNDRKAFKDFENKRGIIVLDNNRQSISEIATDIIREVVQYEII